MKMTKDKRKNEAKKRIIMLEFSFNFISHSFVTIFLFTFDCAFMLARKPRIKQI